MILCIIDPNPATNGPSGTANKADIRAIVEDVIKELLKKTLLGNESLGTFPYIRSLAKSVINSHGNYSYLS